MLKKENGCPSCYVETEILERLVEKEVEKMQFTQEFTELVVKKAKDIVAENRLNIDAQRQGIINQKTVLENKRNKLEDKMLEDAIDQETYHRKHEEINDRIANLNSLLLEIENNANVDIDLIEEVSFTRNIHRTYTLALQFLKRHYLRFFFEKFEVKNKKIEKIIYTPIFSVLQANNAIILRELEYTCVDDYRTLLSSFIETYQQLQQYV